MPDIQVLPEHVANQIAAGEVVERPASVVKELVENALDAGATRIRVELRQGGKASIEVADNGQGMTLEQAQKAVKRHATSKIFDANDLVSVSSFGFRGEALPSIAAVSRMEITTAPEDKEIGGQVRLRGGQLVEAQETMRRPGTTVTVRSLFFNTPARLKQLKDKSVETRQVSQLLSVLALSSLSVDFTLISDGNILLDVSPTNSFRHRIEDIWGRREAQNLLEIDSHKGALAVRGLIEQPDAAREGSRRRHLFINNRPFSNRRLRKAIDEAYRTTVAPDVRPSAFLKLELPPEQVDVNVHPQKTEVTFDDLDAVQRALESVIRKRLQSLDTAPATTSPAPPSPSSKGDAARGPEAPESPVESSDASVSPPSPRPPSQLEMSMEGASSQPKEHSSPEVLKEAGELFQIENRYILVPTPEGLFVVDQHAAHERILFEEWMERLERETPQASQQMLLPATFELSPAEFQSFEQLQDVLEQLGFDIGGFGGQRVILRASPRPHPHFDPERCFREMIAEMTEGSELVNSARNQQERIAKSLACKGAIKAGQPLSGEEMEELIRDLRSTELPAHDVHGRPTMLRITSEDLDRRFRRS